MEWFIYGARRQSWAVRFQDAEFGDAVKNARAMVALGTFSRLEVADASGRSVCWVHENSWEPLAGLTLAERVELDRIYQPDEFIGYTWRGSDARAGFCGDCTEEQVLELANDCRDVEYLTDEDDFESLASDILGNIEEPDGEAVGHKPTSDLFRVEHSDGEQWCESAEMALRTARVHCTERGGCKVSKDNITILRTSDNGLTVKFAELQVGENYGDKLHELLNPFLELVAQGH